MERERDHDSTHRPVPDHTSISAQRRRKPKVQPLTKVWEHLGGIGRGNNMNNIYCIKSSNLKYKKKNWNIFVPVSSILYLFWIMHLYTTEIIKGFILFKSHWMEIIWIYIDLLAPLSPVKKFIQLLKAERERYWKRAIEVI